MKENKKIYFTGDIHGEFKMFMYTVLKRYEFKDCHIIVCGDIGLGFYKLNYYIDMFNKMNKAFKRANIDVYFVRGNHDDPSYFNDTPKELKYFSRVHIVQDYTVLHINNHHILCVGGAVSTDKYQRTKDVDWWEFEDILPYEKLDYKNIDVVVTHAAPLFCNPSYKELPRLDFNLNEQAFNSRNRLAKMYFDLIENNKLQFWFYGHYHESYSCELSNNINDFSEQDKYFLTNGHVLENEKHDEDSRDLCVFVGLGMIECNDLDYFMLYDKI